jgi:DNA-binding transcriptional LysR family regulator
VQDLTSLKLFVYAAELGSLSRAAERSGTALAAVSRRIAMLESHYRTPLFHRTGRGVTLTPAGAAFLQGAQDILLRAAALQGEMAEFARGVRGVIRLHASTSAITQFLPADLAPFAAAHPDLRIDLREAFSVTINRAVREGEADLGVVIGEGDQYGLDVVPYRQDRLTIVARANSGFPPAPTHFASLAAHDLVLMEDSTATTQILRSASSLEGVPLRVRAQVGSFDAVCRMVQAGFGISVLPELAARNFVDAMELMLVPLLDPWAVRQIALCTNAERPLPIETQRLRAHLIAVGR